jgi:hypothetical protein
MIDYKKIDWSKAATDTLADYEKAKSKTTQTTQSSSVDLTKYFTIALDEGAQSGEKSVRILPNQDDPTKWYKVGYFHNLKIGKRWTKLYDPSQDGDDSPLNEMYKFLMKSTDKEDKKLAINYKSRQFFIVRVIERGKEHEGVKFWRFPAVQDGSGIMDKIAPLVKKYGAFWNPFEGFDITISMLRDKSKDSKVGFTKVSSIIPDRESKLSEDENQSVEWLSNPMAWTDVFKKKSIEYLNIVAEGSEPIWDAEQKCFIAKVEDGVSTYTGTSAPTPKAKYETPAPVAMSEEDTEEDTDVDGVVEESAPAGQLKIDDLPF